MNFSLEPLAITYKAGRPDKRPVLFVHGNTQNDTCGQSVIEFFENKGHTVCSYDLPGHGESELESENYQFSDLIDLNHKIIEHYHLKEPILCGHSIGSMIQSGTIAKYNLKEASLIVFGGLDGDPVTTARANGMNDLAEAMDSSLSAYIEEGAKLFKRQKKYDYFANREVDESITQIINLRNTPPAAGGTNLNTLSGFSARNQLIDLNTPILVLHGEAEEVIPKALVIQMVSEYQNIKAEWYPAGGHCAFYQQPQLTVQYLTKHYEFVTAASIDE